MPCYAAVEEKDNGDDSDEVDVDAVDARRALLICICALRIASQLEIVSFRASWRRIFSASRIDS